MPITEPLMDSAQWQIELDPATPKLVLDTASLANRLWAHIVVTPEHFRVGELSGIDLDSNSLMEQARFVGPFLDMGEDRLSMVGEGLEWWFGKDGDGGDLYAGAPFTADAGSDFQTIFTNRIMNKANGITAGTIDSDATAIAGGLAHEGGDTARELLDTLCAIAPAGPNYWRFNPDGSIDADSLATLWPSTNTPTVLLTQEGGHESAITGLQADLRLARISGREVRTDIAVDWNDGVNNGTAINSFPSTWAAFDGSAPEVRTLLHWRPKRPRPPTERWRKVAAWGIKAQTQANKLAAREQVERNRTRTEVTAEVAVYDPWRYDLTPGNTVFYEDWFNGLSSLSNPTYYRGEIAYPRTGLVNEMTSPLLEGYGVYLRYWDGADHQWLDLSEFYVPEEGRVRLSIDHRARFPVGQVRARRLGRQARRDWYSTAHYSAIQERRLARLDRFYQGISRH